MWFPILILAALLRFWNLGAESVWLDEATSLVVADNPPAQLVAFTAEDIHPPLYYFMLHAWLVFGKSETAIRSLSAVIGVLSVAALYGLSRMLWSRPVGLLAALWLAVSPLHIGYSQEARMYALAALWAILSCWLMALAWKQSRWFLWAGYVLVTACGMYTHYYMGFVVLAQNVFVGLLLVRRRVTRPLVRSWLLAQLAWVALFAPWLPIVVRQVRGGGGAWVEYAVGRPSWRVLWDTFIGFSIGPVREWYPVWLRRGAYVLYGVILAGAIWSVFRPAGERDRVPSSDISWTRTERGVFCLFWCVVPLLVAWLASQFKPMYALRYLLPFLPPFCLLMAIGLSEMETRRRGIGMVLTSLLLIVNLGGVWVMAQTVQKPDWRGLSAYLLSEKQPGDILVPEPFWNAKPLRYYVGNELPIYDGMPLPATPAGIAEAVTQASQGHERIWLIEDVGHYGDRERLLAGYLDAHYERLYKLTYPEIGEVTLYQMGGVGK